jgi:hypothetical protein
VIGLGAVSRVRRVHASGEPVEEEFGPGGVAGELHDDAAAGAGDPCGDREQPQTFGFPPAGLVAVVLLSVAGESE